MPPDLLVLSAPDRARAGAPSARREVYLDYNASAPLDPRVAAVMVPTLVERSGNASSTHSFGQKQAAAVDDARQAVAALVGNSPSGVVFTSSATEANNLALRGAVDAAPPNRSRILVSAVEHASVLRTARWLDARGLVELDVAPVTPGGFVDLSALESLLGPDVLLVSVVAANGETGVINPLQEISELVRSVDALFHTDATQMVGGPREARITAGDHVSLTRTARSADSAVVLDLAGSCPNSRKTGIV